MSSHTEDSSTSCSLIERVRSFDPAAWRRLCEVYGPIVYRWAKAKGLQATDAADVGQEVFRTVAQKIASFRRDRPGDTFRGWLWTITRNQVRLFHRKRQGRPVARGGTDAQRLLAEQPDLFDESAAEPNDAEAKKSLVHRALELIRHDFQHQTWQAFLRLAMAGQSAVEIAEELGMTPAAVRQAKYRVLTRLHDELEQC